MNGTSTSIAIDDYLKVIYSHTEWQAESITPSQLAVRLGLAPSSVTEMVKKLAAAGLVDHRPYSAIRLTEQGEERAVAMVRRHRLIETWLVRVFDYGWDEVHDEAEVLEHALSDRLLDAIDAQLGYPGRDPHGDVIPAADGTLRRPAAVRLDEAPHGFEGVIVRISDRDPDVLRVVDRLGLALDDAVTVEPADGVGAGVGVRRRGGSVVVLAPAVAGALWIAPHNATPARSR
ncbi:MAG: metal-dependent transcriptional regulator [Microcella pacifica]|uniref:Manganese transport regulator n=1 Tax=Microcella pacifica TaxID=2591847 RepID=A0A9E5MGW4_9MICO|nr:metal-dependent transcriptional regulator [Microcella pacifica]MBR22267.1 transcriptional regulator [Leifsonia sp.]NHF61685.1 metal-dependent transcriptional regulator [Microcella pacifica]